MLLSFFSSVNGYYWYKQEILITYPLKFDMHDIADKLNNVDDSKRKDIILAWMKRLEEIRWNITITWSTWYSTRYKKYVLNYIEKELAQVF